jgi:asparagine synthase (glutamine-hydrolysing)
MLKPRGPDSAGLFVQDRIRLGRRLLSILGLGASSQQPMIDPDLGIVFKGCVDNFREHKGHSKLWQTAVLEILVAS